MNCEECIADGKVKSSYREWVTFHLEKTCVQWTVAAWPYKSGGILSVFLMSFPQMTCYVVLWICLLNN